MLSVALFIVMLSVVMFSVVMLIGVAPVSEDYNFYILLTARAELI
jgi:hypothetical protein